MMSKSSRPSGQMVLGVVHPVQKQGYWGAKDWRSNHVFHSNRVIGDDTTEVSRYIVRRCIDDSICIPWNEQYGPKHSLIR
jgi:hypothetical protein